MKPIQQALQILKEAQEEINQLFLGTEHVHNLLEINTGFKRIQDRMQFMGATFEPEVPSVQSQQLFKPITKFMGTNIDRAKPIPSSERVVPATRKEAFLAQVDKLFRDLPSLTPQAVLNSFTQKDDLLALRGVARRAGLLNYETREINISFIQELVNAIGVINENTTRQRLIDMSKQTLDPNQTSPSLQQILLTPENIIYYPQLIGATIGDSVHLIDGEAHLVKRNIGAFTDADMSESSKQFDMMDLYKNDSAGKVTTDSASHAAVINQTREAQETIFDDPNLSEASIQTGENQQDIVLNELGVPASWDGFEMNTDGNVSKVGDFVQEDGNNAINDAQHGTGFSTNVNKQTAVTSFIPLTQADIDADPDLVKLRARPGMYVVTDASGKKTVQKNPPKA